MPAELDEVWDDFDTEDDKYDSAAYQRNLNLNNFKFVPSHEGIQGMGQQYNGSSYSQPGVSSNPSPGFPGQTTMFSDPSFFMTHNDLKRLIAHSKDCRECKLMLMNLLKVPSAEPVARLTGRHTQEYIGTNMISRLFNNPDFQNLLIIITIMVIYHVIMRRKD